MEYWNDASEGSLLIFYKDSSFYIPNIPTFQNSKNTTIRKSIRYDNHGHPKDRFRMRVKIHYDHNIGRIR